MIVQCPSCASRYRIRDANIPPSGGKIRCPSCSHAFIVYPEAPTDGDDDGDRTSVTSQGDISNLVNQMAGSRAAADEEDRVSTQIASTRDRDRALAALASELGNPLDQDGTVEIQNPMKVWQEAQNALRNAPAAPAPADTYDDDDEIGATEVVDPKALTAALRPAIGAPAARPAQPPPRPSGPLVPPPSPVQKAAPTPAPARVQPPAPTPAAIPSAFQQPAAGAPPTHASAQPARRDSDAGLDDSGQYAPHTPPGGRQTFESWDQPVAAATHSPSVGMFERSPSGLTSAALFDDDDGIPNIAPLRNAAPTPNMGFGGFGAPTAAPMAPPAQAPGVPGADPGHPGPWKLKTNFGLTYEFPDTRGLRSWLSSREELDGYTVSADDGASFHALSNFPQLDKSAGRSPSMSGNFSTGPSHGSGTFPGPSGSGQFPSQPHGFDSSASGSGLHRQPTGGMPVQNPTSGFKGPVVNSEYRPPSREGSKTVLWLVFFVLLLIAVAVALETFGIFKLSDIARDLGILPAEQTPVTKPANDLTAPKEPSTVETLDPEALALSQEAEIQRLLRDAERLVKGNKLPAALEMLETTEKLAPDNIAVHDLKATVYEKLGQAQQAEVAKAKADELRAAQAPAAGPDAGVVDEPAPDEPDKKK